MSINFSRILLFLLITLLSGCAPSANDVVEEWKAKGWRIVEVRRIQGKIVRHGKLISEQAQAIEASWIEHGNRKTKLYHQIKDQFLVLRFFKKNKDEFVVVMKKRK